AGRILADLGAEVVLPERPGGSPRRTEEPIRFEVHSAGKTPVAVSDYDQLTSLLRTADVVLAHGALPDPPPAELAPAAVWVVITPFGLSGARLAWRASDLTVQAAGGGLYATGDPDRPPVRCSQPVTVAHSGPEAVIAALTAVAAGTAQVVDVSIQEVLQVANMTGPARFPLDGNRGRRRGVFTGRTRETWACRDGWVSFGLRGGGARVKNLQTLTELCVAAGVATPAVSERDWSSYDPKLLSDAELRAIESVVAEYFARHTMTELYEVAVATGLMLAPTNSARELLASEQLAAREWFTTLPGLPRLPRTFVRSEPRELVDLRAPVPQPGSAAVPSWPARASSYAALPGGTGAWEGVRIVEFGSGAAGPIATRYFADHGATVVRVESRRRPDFLRTYALGPGNPHGLEGSVFFAVLNAGKRSLALDLKHPQAAAVAQRLVLWADVVTDNFAPGAMDRMGLGAELLRDRDPALIVASASLQGATGPHRDYPGFGGQGSALSGYTFLTGWPDRAPVGPAGTITDSLAPRFAAAGIAAALLHRRLTGEGCLLDLAQVEAAAYTLSAWLAEQALTGASPGRDGNRSPHACPHGVFPCRGEDRWIALAVHTDDDWARLAARAGWDRPDLATVAARLVRSGEVEELVAGFTGERDSEDLAAALQADGLDAYPVLDWGDLHDDPALSARGHFRWLDHPVMGTHPYEEAGFRLTTTPGGVRLPGPTLGQHTEEILVDLLGFTSGEVAALAAAGALT
ncbi:MAG: CaiB/BaiF CoA-transferase family protein, partial [Mycobacteriales bacterium]